MRKKYILLSLLLLIPALVFALTYEWVIDQMEYATDNAAQLAYVTDAGGGLPSSEYSSDANTQLLLHCNGSDASTTIPDSGNTNHGNAVVSGNAELDTAYKQFGTASLLLPGGVGDNISYVDHADWDLGTGDFTVDFWIRRNGNQSNESGIVSNSGLATTGWVLNFDNGNNKIQLSGFASGSFVWGDLTSNTALTNVTWTHFAMVRYGNTLTFYQGGVVVGSLDVTGYSFADSSEGIMFGQADIDNVNSGHFNGHLDEIRISKGLARWTSAFDVLDLQSYSESTIKQQGTYSLKVVAVQTDSLNDTLTKTLTGVDKLDLTNAETIEYDIYALRTGSNIKLSIKDSGGTTTEHTANVASSNTNQTESWDISGVSDANKDDIDEIKITIINADADNTFFLDDLKWGITAVSGGNWTFVQ